MSNRFHVYMLTTQCKPTWFALATILFTVHACMHGNVYGVYDIQGVCDTDMCESGDGHGRMLIVCGNENVHVACEWGCR